MMIHLSRSQTNMLPGDKIPRSLKACTTERWHVLRERCLRGNLNSLACLACHVICNINISALSYNDAFQEALVPTMRKVERLHQKQIQAKRNTNLQWFGSNFRLWPWRFGNLDSRLQPSHLHVYGSLLWKKQYESDMSKHTTSDYTVNVKTLVLGWYPSSCSLDVALLLSKILFPKTTILSQNKITLAKRSLAKLWPNYRIYRENPPETWSQPNIRQTLWEDKNVQFRMMRITQTKGDMRPYSTMKYNPHPSQLHCVHSWSPSCWKVPVMLYCFSDILVIEDQLWQGQECCKHWSSKCCGDSGTTFRFG